MVTWAWSGCSGPRCSGLLYRATIWEHCSDLLPKGPAISYPFLDSRCEVRRRNYLLAFQSPESFGWTWQLSRGFTAGCILRLKQVSNKAAYNSTAVCRHGNAIQEDLSRYQRPYHHQPAGTAVLVLCQSSRRLAAAEIFLLLLSPSSRKAWVDIQSRLESTKIVCLGPKKRGGSWYTYSFLYTLLAWLLRVICYSEQR